MHTGCTLLFYETYGKSSCPEQELSPRYALLAEDSIVQAVPEHPKKENVFCLSNAYGDVYLFQVRSTLGSHTRILKLGSTCICLWNKLGTRLVLHRLLCNQRRHLSWRSSFTIVV